MRLQLPLALLMLMFGSILPAQETDFDLSKIPREGRSLDDFTPRGWSVDMSAERDLNADGIADIAAILVQQASDSDEFESRQRVVLVLVSGANGTLSPGGSDGGLLVCVQCGGVKESVAVRIEKGILVVNQMTGSREFTDQTWRFRYDVKTHRFVLIGKDVTNGDIWVGGQNESYNFSTGLKISERYRYDEKRDRKITISSKKEKIPKQSRFLEDVGME